MDLVRLGGWGVRILCNLGLGCKDYGPFVGIRSKMKN
jgi:hypothetical protein